ncbi:MAG: CvpA family protein [Chloroflexi bacterium]|nr:CvpA family protein [Chloroflexota bacterium]
MIGSWLDLLILFILALCLGPLPGRGVAQGAVATTLGFLSVGFGAVAMIVAAPGLADLLVEIGLGPVGANISSLVITFTLGTATLLILGQAARQLLKDTFLAGWLDKVVAAVVGPVAELVAGLVGASWLVQFLSVIRPDEKAIDGSSLATVLEPCVLKPWLSFIIDILRARGPWVVGGIRARSIISGSFLCCLSRLPGNAGPVV